MGEMVFTGSGDDAHDERVRSRARAFASMDEKRRRLDRSGEPLRKIVDRVYTTNLTDPPEKIVSRNAWEIVGALFPGLVISARSAAAARALRPEGRPDAAAFVFLTGAYRRNVSLPGLEIRIAKGAGPQPGDIPFMGLHLASPERHCLENLVPSRDRSGMARTAGPEEVERFLARQAMTGGPESLVALRDRAREIAPALGLAAAYAELEAISDALLKSGDAKALRTEEGRAFATSEPFDHACAERLDVLHAFLSSNPMPSRPAAPGREAAVNTAFVESYFSNYIEGTTFLVDEAEDIVFNSAIPASRPKDGHDVLATFRQLSDAEGLRRTPSTAEEFLRVLKARHAGLMDARPEIGPGRFKTRPNRAGNTVFVRPENVTGTLRYGFRLMESLDDPFARAVFVHFLVADVHPFDDGNGRLSRIMMAGELEAGGLERIVVPTVFRDDYVGSLRSMTRFSDPGACFRALNRLQEATSAASDPDRRACIEKWASACAFVEAGRDAALETPDPSVAVEWRDGVPAPVHYWEASRADRPRF